MNYNPSFISDRTCKVELCISKAIMIKMITVIDFRLIAPVKRENLMTTELSLDYEEQSTNLLLTTAFVNWHLSHTDSLPLVTLMAIGSYGRVKRVAYFQ